MADERCIAVIERAEDGPSERRERHPFLGVPLALCGHEEAEHRPEEDGQHAVCFLCLDLGIQPCWHPYTAGVECELCMGVGWLWKGRPHQGDTPCPAGCILGWVAKGENDG